MHRNTEIWLSLGQGGRVLLIFLPVRLGQVRLGLAHIGIYMRYAAVT